MRIILAASDLHDALKQSAYARTTPLDAIRHVLVETVDAEHVAIEATDMNTRTRITLPADVVQPGEALIEGDKLLAISSGSGEITLADTVHATRGRSRYQLPTLPAADFPRADEASFVEASLPPAALAAAIAQVEHAADEKDARPFCRCVIIANGYVAAGNGIAVSAVALEADVPAALIPVNQVRHLQGLLHDNCRISLGNVREIGGLLQREQAGLFRVEAGNTVVTIVCLAAAPFDARQHIDSIQLPGEHVVVKRKPLIDAVRRFAPFVVTYGKGDSGVVLVSQEGQVRVADAGRDARNSEDVSEHVAEAAGGDYCAGIAHRYLLAALNAIDAEEVDVYPSTSARPHVFLPRGASHRQVVHLIAPQALKA